MVSLVIEPQPSLAPLLLHMAHGNASSSTKFWFFIELPIRVGRGLVPSFWHDVWLNNVPLCISYPLLYAFHSSKSAFVRDLWSTDINSWGVCFRRNLKDAEIQEFALFLQDLSSYWLSVDRDQIVWSLEPHRSFTTSSLLKDLWKSHSGHSEPSLFSSIWKDYYPKKIKFFLRESCLHTINTRDKLQRWIPFMHISTGVYV